MTKVEKRWLWIWAIAGLAVPFVLGAIGHYIPNPPDLGSFNEPQLTSLQRRFDIVSTCLFPTQYLAGILALAVTDAGGDSGAGLAGVIISLIALLLNAAVYAGVGLFLCNVGEAVSRGLKGKREAR